MGNLIALASLLLAAPAAAEIPSKTIEKAKACVVSVERTTMLAVNGEKAGKARATGFVADARLGLIATNRHVTGTSPASYRVTFRDGSVQEARSAYYDPFNDIAFLKVSTVPAGAAEAAFAPRGSLAEGDELFLVGNNEGYEYSVKTGRAVNLRVHKGQRHTLCLQTSFDRAGGASGSPVFDAKGRVAAIHASGTDTSSFEVPAAYIEDALYALRAGSEPRRGDPGLILRAVGLREAVKDLRLSGEAEAAALKAAGGARKLLTVERSIEPSVPPGAAVLYASGLPVGDDSYLFDKLMDAAAGGEAALVLACDGSTRAVSVPVADAQAGKVRLIYSFSGGVFTPFGQADRLASGEPGSGALLVRAEKGSPLYKAAGAGESRRTLVTALNGKPVPDLETFIKLASGLKSGERACILYSDLLSPDRSGRSHCFTPDTGYWPARRYSWSPARLEWEVR